MYADAKFQQLSSPAPNGQSLWIYLITGPHTTSVPGLFHAGEAQLAESLGWPLRGFRRAWKEIADRGMAQADWKARVVWLPNAFRYNVPDNPNVVKGWRYALDEVPACQVKDDAVAALKGLLKGLGQPFVEAFAKATGNGLANQDQDQDQDQDQEPKNRFSVIR